MLKQNASWGRRNQRNTPNGNSNPSPSNPRGSYAAQQQTQVQNNIPLDDGGGPGTPFVPQQQQQQGYGGSNGSNAPAEDSYNPVEQVPVNDNFPPSPPLRQFQRQSAVNLMAAGVGASEIISAVADSGLGSAGPSPPPSAHVSPMSRQAMEHNAPLSPYRHATSLQAGHSTSPFVGNNQQQANNSAAVGEEKDSGSVRSARRPMSTPSAQYANNATTTPNAPQQGASTANNRERPSPYSPVPARTSPYTSAASGLSPNMSALVKTGEKRNGVPVTTVNLGYSSGIKRGTSFRDSINNVNSPGKNK